MEADRKDLSRRLASIEGHIGAIRRMVDEGTYCVDILKQTYAIERAVQRFEAELLRRHLSTCVPSGFAEGRDREMVDELATIFELSRK